MRPSIRAALEYAAELTRNNKLSEGFAAGEAAILHADSDEEHAEIRQWLTDHETDFTGRES